MKTLHRSKINNTQKRNKQSKLTFSTGTMINIHVFIIMNTCAGAWIVITMGLIYSSGNTGYISCQGELTGEGKRGKQGKKWCR